MEPWVLIVWLYIDRGGAAFSQEFTSKERCVAVMNRVLERKYGTTAFCVPK